MGKWIDLTGKRFGRLTAVRYVGGGRWHCSCECGGSTECITTNLNRGNSTSCGCKHTEARFKHGMSGTLLHQTWRSMRARCNNPNDDAYANYGGRGIKVCERWQKFENFLADMGMRPKGYELDRRDNGGDYSPENCRWVSKKVNLNNKRTNHMIRWRGKTMPLTAWAERLKIDPGTLFNRIDRGWSLDDAMTRPVQKRRKD